MKMKYVEMRTDERIIHNGYVMGYARFWKVIEEIFTLFTCYTTTILFAGYDAVTMK